MTKNPYEFDPNDLMPYEEWQKRREVSLAMYELMFKSDVDLNHLPKDAIKFWSNEENDND